MLPVSIRKMDEVAQSIEKGTSATTAELLCQIGALGSYVEDYNSSHISERTALSLIDNFADMLGRRGVPSLSPVQRRQVLQHVDADRH